MANIHPSTAIALATVRLVCTTPAGESFGSGFLYKFEFPDDMQAIGVITNKHVVRPASYVDITLTTMPKSSLESISDSCLVPSSVNKIFRIGSLDQRCVQHPDPEVDLAAVMISDIWEHGAGTDAFRHAVLDQSWLPDEGLRKIMRPIEPIVMVGYPNGLSDIANNLPVVRSGLTGSHPLIYWNGKKQFIIDAACFPGSSGSPVFLYEDGVFRNSSGYSPGTRVYLLGVLFAGPTFEYHGSIVQKTIPTVTTSVPVINAMMNLGYVAQADEITALKEALAPLMKLM